MNDFLKNFVCGILFGSGVTALFCGWLFEKYIENDEAISEARNKAERILYQEAIRNCKRNENEDDSN